MAGAVGATWCPRGEKQPRVAKLGCAAACGLSAPPSVGWAPKAPHGVRVPPCQPQLHCWRFRAACPGLFLQVIKTVWRQCRAASGGLQKHLGEPRGPRRQDPWPRSPAERRAVAGTGSPGLRGVPALSRFSTQGPCLLGFGAPAWVPHPVPDLLRLAFPAQGLDGRRCAGVLGWSLGSGGGGAGRQEQLQAQVELQGSQPSPTWTARPEQRTEAGT